MYNIPIIPLFIFTCIMWCVFSIVAFQSNDYDSLIIPIFATIVYCALYLIGVK